MRVKKFLRRFLALVDLSSYIDVEEASASIRENVAFRGPNVVILFCAIIIASVGLNVNSIPVIIGAMLISPLMSPIIGFGLALGTNDTDLLWHSLKHLGVMVGISILSATLYFVLSPLSMEHPTELLARTNPTIYDVLIALFGGLAGILETSRKDKGTVMAGVAIATALMPPLCTVGFGLATWQMSYFFGALYLFFINFTFIALAAFIGTKYLGYPMKEAVDKTQNRYRKWLFTALIVAIIIPSIISAITVIKENNFSRNVTSFVTKNKNFSRSYIYDYKISTETIPATIELYIAGEEPDSAAYESLYLAADSYGIRRQQLNFHLSAAYTPKDEINENELVKQIFQLYETQLEEKNREIQRLYRKIDSLEVILQASIEE